ncbi:hypothetical protein Tco_0486426 [Tanacetum coccineum]
MLKGLERVESIAYKLKLPQELSRVHNTFHISNLKKCCSDDPLAIPLEGLHIDDKFHLVEEPVVIMDRDIKRLKSKPLCLVDDLKEVQDSHTSQAYLNKLKSKVNNHYNISQVELVCIKKFHNLDNLQSIREEENGATEVSDPRDVPGSILLAVIDFATLGEEADWSVIGCEACSSGSSRYGTKRLPKSSDNRFSSA